MEGLKERYLELYEDMASSRMPEKMSEEPYYNCWALWVVANMLYSDHAQSVSMFVAKDELPKVFYTMAVEKLKDRDRPRFVRHYFGV